MIVQSRGRRGALGAVLRAMHVKGDLFKVFPARRSHRVMSQSLKTVGFSVALEATEQEAHFDVGSTKQSLSTCVIVKAGRPHEDRETRRLHDE